MSDIVERLRKYGPHPETSAFAIHDEAADEIERLFIEMEQLRSMRSINAGLLEEVKKLQLTNTELLAALIAIDAELVLPPQLQEIMTAAIEKAERDDP